MKRLKYLTLGIFIGALLATAGSALAAPVVQKINAFTHPDYKVNVDGKDVKLENTPISYNDRTYVPLREIGEIIGYEVGFKSGTISLKKEGDSLEETSTPQTAPQEWVSLSDLAQYGITAEAYIGSSYKLAKEGSDKLIYFSKQTAGLSVVASKDGSLSIYNQDGVTYFKIEDLKALGFLPQ